MSSRFNVSPYPSGRRYNIYIYIRLTCMHSTTTFLIESLFSHTPLPLLSPLLASFSTVLKIMSFIVFGPFTILERSFAFSRSLSPSLGARREGRQRGERKRILSKESKRERERKRSPLKNLFGKATGKFRAGSNTRKLVLFRLSRGGGRGRNVFFRYFILVFPVII